MNPNCAILTRTLPLHQWLGRHLSSKKVTQVQLAILVGRSTAQVNRWLSNKEPIPRPLLLQAVSATMPEQMRVAEQMLHIHDRAKILPNETKHIVSTGGSQTALAVAKIIGQRAEEASFHCDKEGSEIQCESLSQYISAGLHIVNMMKACNENDQPFIHEENIRLHLRFPFNVIASDVINFGTKNPASIEETRNNVLRSMALEIKNKPRGNNSEHVRQHAYHMLARCGDTSARSLVLELTTKSKDLATRRTGLYAQIINSPHPQAAERFIYELERDVALTAVTLEFDLVHYGDKALGDTTALNSVENIIVHNLRHIQTHQSSATAQIALQKLLSILLKYGARPFDRRRIYPRIRSILERLQSMDSTSLTPVEKRFVNHFRCLQLNSISALEPVSPSSDQLAFTFE